MPSVIELRAVPKAGPIVVRFLSHPRYILTHYSQKTKTWPCPGESCSNHARPILKGYAPALEWSPQRGAWIPIVHELTESAIAIVGPSPLLGVCWEFCRINVGRKVRQVTGFQLESLPLCEVVETWDVVPIIERVYRTSNIEWDVSPLLFQKMTAPEIFGSPPPSSKPDKDAKIDPVPMHRFREFIQEGKKSGHADNGQVK